MTKVLVTGCNGFVGKSLCQYLVDSGIRVIGTGRPSTRPDCISNEVKYVPIEDISAVTDWRGLMSGIECVVHLAARVHVITENSADPLAEYRRVNVDGMANLAQQAGLSGVKRFIYLSTIKVNGERTTEKPFSAEDQVMPLGPYAVSKWEAELALRSIGRVTGMEVVIIRPPLVYGEDVKGNFLRLLKLIDKGYPLPLDAVSNKRSMVYVTNLCDLIRVCISHPKANGETFLVSDDHDMSTAGLIRKIAESLQQPARLISVPVSWLYGIANMIRKKPEMERLCGSLQVDIKKTVDMLAWNPPCSVDEGIRKTVARYLAKRR